MTRPTPALRALAQRAIWLLRMERQWRDGDSSPAVCAGCGARLGRIVVQLSTIFGLEEDEAVLQGRCRVY